jgi:hypothetical protein
MSELLDLIEPGEVRAALDPAGLLLDGTSLPTGVILRQVFAGAAVTEVVYRDPDAGTREGTALQRIANALNLLTAANIAPFVVQITREQLGRLDEHDLPGGRLGGEGEGAAGAGARRGGRRDRAGRDGRLGADDVHAGVRAEGPVRR